MSYRYPALAIACFAAIASGAQNNCDCINAQVIHRGSSPAYGSSGTGKLLEISDPSNTSLYYFEKEHNTSWFRFEIQDDVELTFDVIPNNPADDVDFILFRYDEDGFCDRIRSKKMLPVRTNLARSGGVNAGLTGLKPDATEEFVHSGPGNTYSKSVTAKKHEVYYLVVDNVSGPGTYSINLNDGTKDKPKSTIDAAPITADGYVEIKTPFELRIVDDATGAPLKGNVDVAGYQIGEPFHADDTEDCLLELSSSQTITINCTAPGYVFFTKNMIAPSVPFDAKKAPDKVEFEIRLKKIKLGENVTLPNIKFKGDEVEFLPSSRPSLLSLYKFMLDNPSAKIEIGGHVNAPEMRNSGKIKKLSKDRAKAVYDYLILKGIDASRIAYKGYGNSKMIYQKPVNEKQNEENRRVEIRITSI
jgi:outer membrane protein OmpA-like peptidoglycan-associated protein